MPMTGKESWKSFQRSKTIYDKFGRAESSNIYIAQPGHHKLGCLNGIDPDSCELKINLIDPDELSFDVYQMVDDEYTAYYDYVDILMELYVDGLGWFFINESPELHHDGVKEYKSVTAQGYEITLQQYDLEVFHVGTADANDRALLATDNVYTDKESDVDINRDIVRFWRNTSEHKKLLEEINEDTKFNQLSSILYKYPNVVKNDWRIDIYNDSSLRSAFVTMKNNASEYEQSYWQSWIDAYDSTPEGLNTALIKNILPNFPDLLKYVQIKYTTGKSIRQTDDEGVLRYIISEDIDKQYTAYELIETELKRMKELSLMNLVIRDVPEWDVGYIDTHIEPSSYTISWTVTEVPTLENYPASDFGNDAESHVGEIAYETNRGHYYEFAETVEEDFYWRRLPKPDDTFSSLLQNQGGRFEIDNQDVYSVLMQEIAPYYKCVFQFDTKNKLINAYYLPSLGEDTRIFIGLRNVQNEVTISPSQDLYTQFTVENSEGLGIEEVNFGQREIEDISYFLNTKYLPQKLIDKYKIYLAYRDTKRNEYVQLSRDYNAKLEEITELKTKVPSGMLNTDQYETFSDSELQQELENYNALIKGMEDMFTDHTGTLDEDALEASVYWNDYMMIKQFTIPNINIEINNRKKYSYEPKTDFIDDYELDFDTYGHLYGLDELKHLKKMLEDKVATNNDFKRTWAEINEAEDEPTKEFLAKHTESVYKAGHERYVKYKNGLDSCVRELNRRTAEYEALKEELLDINDERQKVAQSVTLKNYSFQNGYLIWKNEEDKLLLDEQPYYLGDPMPVSAFTDEEIARLSLFFRHTDYVNDNINYYSNIDSLNENLIDEQLQMYDAAVDELYAEAHPQYAYNTDIDSLLANNEWEDFVRYWENLEDDYHYIFQVGNFIRLGINEGTSGFQVKLRLTAISFNPMTRDMDMELEFSNMINYRARRNDFATLIDNAIGSAKNQIQAAYQRNSRDENDFEVSYDLIRKILQSSSFSSYTSNLQGSISSGAINSIAGNFDSLVANYMSTNVLTAKLADVDELDADSAFIRYLETNLVVASEIKVDDLKAKLAQIDSLEAGNAFIDYLESTLVVASEIKVDDLKAKLAQVDTLSANSAFMHFLETEAVSARSLNADNATFAQASATALTAEDIDTTKLTANSALVTYLKTEALVANSVNAETASFATTATTALTAEDIDTTKLTANSALVQYLYSDAVVARSLDADNATFANASATSLQADKATFATTATTALSADSIKAENIDTSTVTAQSGFMQYLRANAVVATALNADNATFAQASATALSADSIKAENIDTSTVTADSAFMQYLQANLITASEIDVDDLKAKLATIDTLTAGSAFVTYLQSLSSTTAQSVINDAYIYNAVANKISVEDLAAGNIVLSDTMLITSENGNLVMNGTALQIQGKYTDDQGQEQTYTGVQLGYDNSGTPSLVLRNSDGATILTPSGITSDAVADGLIVNNMVHDGTLSKSKMGFPIVDTDENGNISITNIKDGTGNNFGVEYTNFKNNTQTALDDIEAQKMYRVVVESDNGNIFKNGDINCTLSCRVYSWDDEITDDINAANFTWTRKSKNTTSDNQWNANHSGGTKTITITPADVYGRSVFYCTVTLPDGSILSS